MIYTIKTYEELKKWTKAFAEGTFGLMVVVGAPGHSKSRTMTNTIPEKDRLYLRGGGLTSFQLYKELYYNRNKTILLDDIDQLYNDKALVRLLKSLCETEAEREIRWTSANKSLDSEGIPRVFTTSSRVCIITNRMVDGLNEHLGSLVDRGVMLNFSPSVKTVFEYGKTFFNDKEILDFIEDKLPIVEEFSLRVFETASQAKAAGLDWREAIIETLGIKNLILVRDLMNNNRYTTDIERDFEFTRITGLSRPLFYKYREVIEAKLGKPKRKNHAGGKRKGRRPVLAGV